MRHRTFQTISRAYTSICSLESYLSRMQSTTNKTLNIAIEGNIGAGKSTVLEYLSQSPMCDIVAEPIEKWTNLNGVNLLAMLYSDPCRWSFTFQSHVQLTLARLHAQISKRPIKVMERSIYSARYCFVENLYRNKSLQNVEYEILKQWFETIVSNGSCNLDMIIYLQTNPETCLGRIRTRNRMGEESITIDYLKQLHELHEDWLVRQMQISSIPVFIVDGNQTKEYVYDNTNQHLSSFMSC